MPVQFKYFLFLVVLHARVKWWKADIEGFVSRGVKTFAIVLRHRYNNVLSTNEHLALHNLMMSVINFIWTFRAFGNHFTQAITF